ncbi:MAG: amidohydrolase family protein [Arenimonas sp.]|nr:amidohydrolase family protein [Arenimonas sp.]MBP6309432.1 amidohydrolase family protein [Arenimonas sp.]
MRLLNLFSLSTFLIYSLSVNAAERTRLVILVDGGKQAGEQIVEKGDDGWVNVTFTYKDNGRGPEIKERYRLAADGGFAEYHATGKTMFGSDVKDDMIREGDQVSWSSTSEKGKSSVSGPAFYSPINSSMEPMSVALAHMAKNNVGQVTLLPNSTMQATVVDSHTISRNGENRTVELLKLTGIGLTPVFVWSTTGKTARVFALIIPGYMTMIEEGWESAAVVMTAKQQAAESKVLAEFAEKTLKPLPGLTVIRNVRVFDSAKASLGAASDVYVLRGKITAVLPAGSPSKGADNIVDGNGRVLLPGLFDMHGHIGPWDGPLNLANGVTSSRDMGNDNATLQGYIDQQADGNLLLPNIIATGFLEGESAFSARNGFVIKDLAGAKEAIDWYAQHGYPQLKIYNSFPKEILTDTVAYAHLRGLRVSGHIPVFLRAENAVNAGYDEIQHINQLMLNFLVKPDTDTRTLERFYLPAEQVADLDLNSKPVRDFIDLLVKKGVNVDPTLATFDFIRQRDGELAKPYAAISSHMPLELQRSFRAGTMKIPDDATFNRYNKSYEKMVAFVGQMYRAGVPLVAGTDALAGFTVHSELELYVQAGLTPAQALQVATLNGAKYSRMENSRGQIKPGYVADLVLVDGDPTVNIADLRKVALVFTQGGVLSPTKVFEMMGIKPFVSTVPEVQQTAKPESASASGGNAASHFDGLRHIH